MSQDKESDRECVQEPDVKLPPQAVQDKLAFILNNLTAGNLPAKTPELRRLLTAERWPWFCNYLVVRRAAQVLLCSLL